jgi:hypothetical protein
VEEEATIWEVREGEAMSWVRMAMAARKGSERIGMGRA